MNELLERIRVAPEICHGKPCVKGTRIYFLPFGKLRVRFDDRA
jgi:hypothetical protein